MSKKRKTLEQIIKNHYSYPDYIMCKDILCSECYFYRVSSRNGIESIYICKFRPLFQGKNPVKDYIYCITLYEKSYGAPALMQFLMSIECGQ